MAGINIDELIRVKPFDVFGDQTSVGSRWQRWLKSFELFADSKGLIINESSNANKVQRRALLLHTAGEEVQKIFETLPDTGTAKDYKKAETALNEYFIPQVNTTFQNHVFRSMEQMENETVAQFVMRLRHVAKDCDYGEQTDNQIRDQVVHKCKSDSLRRKLLEKGKNLTLTKTLELAATFETVQQQFEAMKVNNGKINKVNEFPHKGKPSGKVGQSSPSQTAKECYRCGRTGHFGREPQCPARGKTCNKCGKQDHFAGKCKTKVPPKQQQTHRGNQRNKSNIRHVQTEPEDSDEEYAFSVTSSSDAQKINVIVGGRPVNMIIDSGASTNVINHSLWDKLKSEKVKCTSKKCNKKLYAYGNSKPLEVLGSFRAATSTNNKEVNAEFIVIKGTGEPLLGRDTAIQLGVLKMGANINSISSVASLVEKYNDVFHGVGKLKDHQVRLHVDPSVTPVAQTVRRIPFSLRDKVESKVKELQELDIIEPVEGPTPWVSPVVVVPKPNGDIRLCVDMRRANEAIIRERHPIPTVDEVLQTVNQSTVFSKIDLKWGYHQLELDEESRKITTFATHCGLFRYKRLMFGINSAPEVYQHVIQQVLHGCKGASNISDDIIIHGKNREEHDQALENVLQRLKEKNLTLNEEKCKFHMPQLEFMGLLLSDKGIGPTEAKVEAVVNSREPANSSEVRSFLGLANYNARFIPNFASIAEPLRRLTKRGTKFVFGPEQRASFDELKKTLANAETLGYFDKDAKSRIIADASPVGLDAVLIQEQHGQPRVISYASRSLTNVEKRYSQTEKEALALVWACERFHVYLYGMEFEVYTDHKPLEAIYSTRSKPCARIERWVLRLQPYQFKVKYIPGKQNIADPLSRLSQPRETVQPSKPPPNDAEEFVKFVAVTATPKAMTTREIERASAEDNELSELRRCITTNQWESTQCKKYIPVSSELCVIGKLVLRGTRIVIPQVLRQQTLTLAHEGHIGIVSMKQRLRSKIWWPGIDRC